MSEASLTHEFQYSSARHQAETAISGMWLFRAIEVLFFGALFLTLIYSRHWNQSRFDAGARQTELMIGTINTVILVASSFIYSVGAAYIEAGNSRRLIQCCAIAWLLGLAFLILKFRSQLCHQRSAWRRGAHLLRLLFLRYGIAWTAYGRRVGSGRLDHSAGPAGGILVRVLYAAVGLYWSFVEMVWIALYPLIYLVGRGP